MSILVLGASGLLGNAVFRVLSESDEGKVFGTLRNSDTRRFFVPGLHNQLLDVDDLEDTVELESVLDLVQPDCLINCVALRKTETQDLMKMISLFSLFPRRLANLCRKKNIHLVHVSSDGVFQGTRGNYNENDMPDAKDPYGTAKLLGEVDEPGSITLRTSIIGPELQTKTGLLEWFLSQHNQCHCYTRSIFSGFPTIVFAKIILDVILPRPELYGIYHIASQPISKFDLLKLVAKKYGKSINIVPDDTVVIDRSLSAEKFESATGYSPPDWPTLIDSMHSYKFGLMEN